MTPYLPVERNFLGLDEPFCRPETAGVVLLTAPFELTSTYGRGSEHGPQAILDASHEVELFDARLGFEPYKAAGGIATLPPVDVVGCSAPVLAERLRAAAAKWIERGKFVVTIGGEHSAIVGAVQAHCEAFEQLTVLQLDAHSDLRSSYLDDPWNHACAMARIRDFHSAIVQVGIRSQAVEERTLAEKEKMPVFYAHDIHEEGDAWIDRVIEATDRYVYVTFDCDVFDPAIMPATGTPEPDGLTWRQVNSLLARLCKERELVGLDVSELLPLAGLLHPQFMVAKLIYRTIGYRLQPDRTG